MARTRQEFQASQQVVLMSVCIVVRRKEPLSIEIPFAGNSGVAVEMAHANSQPSVLGNSEPEICTLRRIRIPVVGSFAIGVELIAEEVVIETSTRAG